MLPERRLVVIRDEERVELVYDGERRRVLHADGRGSVVDTSGGRVQIAGFEDGALVVETASDRGSRIVERFVPMPSGRMRLEVRVINPLFDEPVSFALHFARAESS